MIIIGNTLLSDEIVQEYFSCDLAICRGGCCVHGDAGAPLEEAETVLLQELQGVIKPFMEDVGLRAVQSQGAWVRDFQGELTTPLAAGGPCAYARFDREGVARCAIEKAWEAGLTAAFKKPLSCHLYPLRINAYRHYDALNYHRWPICECARAKGLGEKVAVFRFVREALIRKYGSSWYEELEEYASYNQES